MTYRYLCSLIVAVSLLFLNAVSSLAWHDKTHMAVVAAAGAPQMAYLAVGADMAKEKFPDERLNHYCNNTKGTVVTSDMVLRQTSLYDSHGPEIGHLYGAIIAAIDKYRQMKKDPSKYALYPLGYAMHYLGDLSMPLHNTEFSSYNRTNHNRNDGVVENEPNLVQEIRSRMAKYKLTIDPSHFRESLAGNIAQVANRSIALGYQLQESNRPLMDKETAYEQLAQSAALLRAAMNEHHCR